MAHGEGYSHKTDRRIMAAIGLLVVVYAAATMAGLTKADDHGGKATPAPSDIREPGAAAAPAEKEEKSYDPPALWSVIPFVLLLGAIAILPLLKGTAHWWESNLHRFYVAAVLAVFTLLYYLLLHPHPGFESIVHVLEHAILDEYIPFIVLLFALYTISGGIRIEGDLRAHPMTNGMFILVGGALASFIGTTGAAMLLVRPLLETNRERKYVTHTVVFFIFVVCNCGGCLLPIGDPPLFLGYLQGVDFLWTAQALWLPWLVTNAILIGVYLLVDQMVFYPRETTRDLQRDTAQTKRLTVTGLWPNAVLLLGVILAVALLDPKKAIPGTEWHPWLFLRETVQLGLVALSLLLGSAPIREQNRFNYHAIVEVAALFVGIFICMQPALEILKHKDTKLPVETPMAYFWATGSLSAVLDNAPTYLVFYKTAEGQFKKQYEKENTTWENLAVAVREPDTPPFHVLVGISLGAVFLGSMTYIGNGPNFMVRAIAEQSGVRMPSFFGYVVKYSVPILIPVFLLSAWLFL